MCAIQESEGVESEYEEEAAEEMEVDELHSDGGEKVSAQTCLHASTCPAARPCRSDNHDFTAPGYRALHSIYHDVAKTRRLS